MCWKIVLVGSFVEYILVFMVVINMLMWWVMFM